jgi:O-antigen ligase
MRRYLVHLVFVSLIMVLLQWPGVRRVVGPFPNANITGLIAAAVLVLMYQSQSWLAAAVSGSLLLLTTSRSALLAVAIVVIVLVMMKSTIRRYGWQLLIALIPMAALFVIITLQRGTSERLLYWSAAWRTWIAQPFIGSGIGSTRQAVAALTGHQHAHNLYLQVAGDTGLVGLSVLLLLVGGLVVLAIRYERYTALLLLVLLAVAGLFDYVYWYLPASALLLVILVNGFLPSVKIDLSWLDLFVVLLLAWYVVSWPAAEQQFMLVYAGCLITTVMVELTMTCNQYEVKNDYAH